ncbi:ABC transporter permease [Gordonia sp. (in: high G+C Gram-positive bacteria)]|uniref:ABC transporter permease n=1 Tax=Gordonia sp. (in: high G+C Gram-positive bacteria) TaxID=84139 RepID=UPI0039E3F2DD
MTITEKTSPTPSATAAASPARDGVRRYTPSPTPTRRGSAWTAVVAKAPYAVSAILGIGAWEIASLIVGSRSFLLPSPWKVLTTSFLDWSHLHPMLAALWLTTRIALGGLAIAALLGVVVAMIMSLSPISEKIIYPYAIILQTIPVLALVPLIGLWFGFGAASRLTVVVLFSIFPIISNTLFGLKTVEPGARDFFRIRGASRWQQLTTLTLPSALPSLFVGLRTASGLAVVGAIVGDMFFAQGTPGIGTLVNLYTARLQSADLYAAIILSSLLGIAVFGAFGFLAHRAVGPWHTAHQDIE